MIEPREPKAILFEHAALEVRAVAGVADTGYGETAKACAVRRDGAGAGPGALIAFCRERVTGYAAPRWSELLALPPESPTDKALKRGLHASAAPRGLV